ncbi:MAG TPA: prolipoprotein diacylglyceryl transferase, partial [Solibacterales bacterium]|nr:prolipoprotein diacylglyceryl transferase [Bryobacterales bacterium]
RLGCFAAGCCWGRECDLPWAVTFRNPNATTGVPLNRPLHPTQLYEAGGEWIIMLALLWAFRRKHTAGQIIGLYLMLYGLLRFVVEFFRAHDSSNPLGLSLSLEQWLALALACAGLFLVVRKPRRAAVGTTIAV